MDPIVYALITPVIGAILYPLLHDHPRFTRIFDRSMYVIVPLLVLSQVVGHEIEHSGGWDTEKILLLLGIMTLGLLMPIGIEYMFQGIASKTEALSIIAGFAGLGVHALLEGASLNTEEPTAWIPIAVHRVAVGLMIWWISLPRYGLFIAVFGITGLLATTLSGFLLTDLLPYEFAGSDFFQAFVAGSLLHVIFHEKYHGSPHAHDH
ncbi:MAG: hypothetical protein OXF48_07305 [Bacteroidetes bacterium]|nr:hypothetical protein [Bacteroidota bacterium]